MSDDLFPIDETRGGPVRQLDLSHLEDKLARTYADPSKVFKDSDAKRPSPAAPTKGPHRISFTVPYNDETDLSLGAPYGGNHEPGIAGRTKSQVHFFVSEGNETPTCLHLGRSVQGEGLWANALTDGFAMTTHGDTYMWSKRRVSMTSFDSTMTLRAREEVYINSFEQNVTLSSGKDITGYSSGNISFIAGPEPQPIDHSSWDKGVGTVLLALDAASMLGAIPGVWSDKWAKSADRGKDVHTFLTSLPNGGPGAYRDEIERKYRNQIMKAIKHVAVSTKALNSWRKSAKKAKPRKAVWDTDRAFKVAKAAMETLSEITSIYSDYIKKDDKKKSGEFNVTAHGNISMSSDKTILMNGFKGIVIDGFRSLVGCALNVYVYGEKETLIWGGTGTSIKAVVGDVSIASDWRGASLKGMRDVEMSSEKGNAMVTGEASAQLNSVGGMAYVHGKTGSYLGAGEQLGFGVVARPDRLQLGAVKHADSFDKASGSEQDAVITVDDNKIQLETGDTKVLFDRKTVDLRADRVVLKARSKDIAIGAKRVLIG